MKNFLAQLSEEFFEEHKSFLRIPLLAVIMAIAFKDTAEISQTLSEFYEDAYSALLTRHDATKGRERCS